MMKMRNCTYTHLQSTVTQRAKSEGLVDQAEMDWSLLRPTPNKLLNGFQEAKSAFDNGTDEVRQLLLHECSIIYECNVCRNMFRNLADFISHKRIFCCSSYNNFSNQYGNHNSTIIIQEPDIEAIKRTRSAGASPTHLDCSQNHTNHISCTTEVSIKKESNSNGENHQPPNISAVLHLERLENSSKAMYQTLKRTEGDSIKTEINEVHEMLKNTNTILGPDGKAVRSIPYRVENDCYDQLKHGLTCTICKIVFQTEKTLKLHIQKKHIPSTYVYQCPTCTLTFLQPAAVIRHLANEHKKSSRRIRMMRETILKRRIHISEVQSKKPNRELKRLQLDEAKEAEVGLISMEEKKVTSTCVYCEKTFERRAALSTHLLHCRSKQEVLQRSPLPIKRTKVQSYETLLAVEAKPLPSNKDDRDSTYMKVENDLDVNEAFANLNKQSFGSGLRTLSLENLEMLDDENTASSSAEEDKSFSIKLETSKEHDTSNSADDKTDANGKDQKIAGVKQLSCRCKICNKQFTALSNLRRHISMFHYRARKFGCKLCDYRAFRRYDIVNHLGFVHKMTGERDAMSVEYVSVHEVHYTKDDVESDIVLLTDEDTKILTAPHHVKRKKRPKTFIPTPPVPKDNVSDGEGRSTRLKLKRSNSNTSSLPPAPVTTGTTVVDEKRRPIRNRIKPVNSDFVYDLSKLLTVGQGSERGIKKPNNLIIEQEIVQCYKGPLVGGHKDEIKGAAQRLASTLVSQGRAASSTAPELPLERPVMRQNLTSTQRVDMQAGPVIETTELEAQRLKATLLDDSFLDKISKRSNATFKLKPCLELTPHRTLDSLLEKFDTSLHNNASKTSPQQQNGNLNLVAVPAMQIDAILGQTDLVENEIGNYIDPIPSIPSSNSPPPTPKKRITLMERLAENKAKHREPNQERIADSLLRSALQN